MKVFFIVLARDRKHVKEKINELNDLGVPYVFVCGEPISAPNIVYRKPVGKYDAINFGAKFVPYDADIVVLNDVDTRVHGFNEALKYFAYEKVALVFSKVIVKEGPQTIFYLFLDSIRKWMQVTASGELMLLRHEVFDKLIPLEPCKAEDSYILFKVLELGFKSHFSTESYVETERTKSAAQEEPYKRKTVAGLYQALSYTNPPRGIRLFYIFLPLFSPLLLILGKNGYYWMKGILRGFVDYLRGDRIGSWQPTYME